MRDARGATDTNPDNLTTTGYGAGVQSAMHRVMHRAKIKGAIDLKSRNNVRYRLQPERGQPGNLVLSFPPVHQFRNLSKVPASRTILLSRKGRLNSPFLEMSDSISYAGPNRALLEVRKPHSLVKLWMSVERRPFVRSPPLLRIHAISLDHFPVDNVPNPGQMSPVYMDALAGRRIIVQPLLPEGTTSSIAIGCV